jgi:hypothetical protein
MSNLKLHTPNANCNRDCRANDLILGGPTGLMCSNCLTIIDITKKVKK